MSIFFSKSTTPDMRTEIREDLGIPKIVQYEKYLELPSLMVQAIPTYTMCCFKLPLGLCHEIEKLIRGFWWGQWGDRRKIHWVKWEKNVWSKIWRWHGFQGIIIIQWCSFIQTNMEVATQHKFFFFYKVFKSKFFPNCSIMEANEGYWGSYAWRSILKGREVIRRGAKWRVGNGESIKLWGDKWLPSLQSPSLQSPLTTKLQNATVSSLINTSTRQWNIQLLPNLFN